MAATAESGVSEQIQRALDALRAGQCVAILDDESREAETDLFFPASAIQPADLRRLRVDAGGELYIAVGHEVAETFGIPYISAALEAAVLPKAPLTEPDTGSASCNGVSGKSDKGYPVLKYLGKGVDGMCQGSCSVGLSLDHRSTHTGAPDSERSLTCRRLALLWEEIRGERAESSVEAGKAEGEGEAEREDAMRRLGKEFHTPGHIFLCIENPRGLRTRQGHTELSVALAKLAGITPVMVGCVMLSNSGDDYGALPAASARQWAAANSVPCLTGPDVIKAVLGQDAPLVS
ncbi:hypothetical protein CLOM_g14953 [Closterium sp. NIES-68]|nr:hypothetical protein CLOM_g14953 [Closterium sp. NIES-68]GJP70096.1 hypothetical protein CLOP_g1081 [Closterium sp. NIES-67]